MVRWPFVQTPLFIADAERGQVFHGNTVVVSGARIAAVGVKVRVLPRTRVTNARRRLLIPGLWNRHCLPPDRWEWSRY